MSDNGFDVKAFLTKDTFTIPVEVTDRDNEGKDIKRALVITYKFGPDQENIFQVKEGRTVAEQLSVLVQKVKGMEEQPTKEFWEGVGKRQPKCIIAIAEAILGDVFPNAQTTPEV